MCMHTRVVFRWSQMVCICDDNSHAISRIQHSPGVFSILWLSQSFCLLWCSLGLGRSDIDVLCGAEHSTVIYLSPLASCLWVSALTSALCKKLLWQRQTAALVCGYKCIQAAIVCSFSKISAGQPPPPSQRLFTSTSLCSPLQGGPQIPLESGGDTGEIGVPSWGSPSH